MSDKCCINLVSQINGIHFLLFKHIDVLRLCNLVCDIEDVILVFFFAGFKVVWKSDIFAFHVLEDDVIFHLVIELLIADAAKFNERADIIPVFLIIFAVCLTHTGKLFCYFLCNVIRNLLNKSVIL